MNTFLKNREKRKEAIPGISSSEVLLIHTKKKYLISDKLYKTSKAISQRVSLSKSNIVQILQSYNNEKHAKFEIQRAYLLAIKNAKHSIRISTPYFMPPPPVAKILGEAVARGVDVQILTQGKSDRPIMFWAAQHAYYQYIRKGIRIHEMLDRELHAKTIEIDGYYANIGSDNLDHISWAYNSEAKVEIFDSSVAKKLSDNFKSSISVAREIDIDYMERRSIPLYLMSYFAYVAYHFVYPWKKISHLE